MLNMVISEVTLKEFNDKAKSMKGNTSVSGETEKGVVYRTEHFYFCLDAFCNSLLLLQYCSGATFSDVKKECILFLRIIYKKYGIDVVRIENGIEHDYRFMKRFEKEGYFKVVSNDYGETFLQLEEGLFREVL